MSSTRKLPTKHHPYVHQRLRQPTPPRFSDGWFYEKSNTKCFKVRSSWNMSSHIWPIDSLCIPHVQWNWKYTKKPTLNSFHSEPTARNRINDNTTSVESCRFATSPSSRIMQKWGVVYNIGGRDECRTVCNIEVLWNCHVLRAIALTSLFLGNS